MRETLDHYLRKRNSAAEVTAVALEEAGLHFSIKGYSTRNQQSHERSVCRNIGRVDLNAGKIVGRDCPMKN